MKLNKILLAGVMSAASALAAQAAELSLASGSVAGSLAAQATVNGETVSFDAVLDDLSGAGFVLGAGASDASRALTPAGSVSQLWSAAASLDTTLDPASAAFSAGSAGALSAHADGQFEGSLEAASLWLEAELAIVSAEEAVGTPVRVDVAGSAESLWASSGPTLELVPTFDLVVRDAGANILGSWQGLDAGGSESFSFSFQSLVGEVLSFSLSHDSQAMGGAAAMAAGAGHTLDNAAWLEGTITVTAVPEPESYALFLAGLTAIGLFGRRRLQR
ncbi:MAG: PEP-CTERM sorting domain-containing protein [Betaproteobacteria bacterium]|jgi:hypothetical protein|nr:PEP-CTERM sorting domain-containing protein [Betaproteobacteria bacterium]